MSLAPTLTPRGHLLLVPTDEPPAIDPAIAARLLKAFEAGSGDGLLHLGAGEVGTVLPAALAYWRDFAARFVTAVCTQPGIDQPQSRVDVLAPPAGDLEAIASAVPPMRGAEYATVDTLRLLWDAVGSAFNARLAAAGGSVQQCLKSYGAAWNLVGRVHFNLAENRQDPEAPFAFLATYTG